MYATESGALSGLDQLAQEPEMRHLPSEYHACDFFVTHRRGRPRRRTPDTDDITALAVLSPRTAVIKIAIKIN